MNREELAGTAELTATTELQSVKQERIAGRYEVREKLGSGGMSTVYLAHDHKDGVDVAIKFMKTDLGGSARRRFFREFNTIAGVQHPCCLKVYEIGETQQAPYFTMELHPGRPVDSILGDPPEIIAPMLVDLTLAVDYIHSQGIVHRDIKPSNVLVQRSGDRKNGKLTCKLADFGLAKFYQLDSSLTNERGLVGTPAYCAPEQIDGGEIDHRVDLYAIGVLAFELLSGGRHPFASARSQGMHALLHAQLSSTAPKLSEINPNVSPELAEIVNSYLAKEPDLRPSSALPLRRVLCEQYGVEVDSRLAELSSPSEVKLNAVGFVCREPELKQVDQFLLSRLAAAAELKESQCGTKPLMLFSGEPGTGKTSIMQEAVRRSIGHDFQVFEGRCFDSSTSSFQPVIEIIRQILSSAARVQRSVEESTLLADYQASQSDLTRMNKIIADYSSELHLIAPELRRWLSGEAQTPAFSNDSEYIFRALASMFLELGQVTPLCLCFDDIQWADNSTLAFLQHLAAALSQRKHDGVPSKPATIAIFCTGRSGYPLLQKFSSKLESQALIDEVALQTLSFEEARELLALRLGCLGSSITDELTDAIHSLCQGNPFFVSETIREWYTRGMVVRTTDGWQRVHATVDEESSLPSSVRSALRTRISDLSEIAQQLVPAAATIGRIVDLDLLASVVAELEEGEMLDAVDELISKRVFVETNTASRVSFAHDLLRETAQAELSANRTRALHRKIASVLELRNENGKPVSPAILANHYLAGEMTSKAFDALLAAAENSLTGYAFEDALGFLDQAKNNEPTDLSPQEKFRLHRLLTFCTARSGQTERAKREGAQALHYALSPEDSAKILGMLGTFDGVIGDSREGQAFYDQALSELGMPRAKARWRQFIEIPYNVFAFHVIPAPILSFLNRTSKNASQHNVACELLYEFAHSVAVNDVITYTQVCTTNIRLAKPLDNNCAKGVAFAKYGLNLAFSGVNARLPFGGKRNLTLAVRYGYLGVECAKKDKRSDVWASVENSLGFCYYCTGALREAEETLLAVEKILRRCRDLHTSYCYHFLRHTYSVIGDPTKTLEAGLNELDVASSTNDVELMGWAQFGLTHAYALQGDTNRALSAADESIRLLDINDSSFATVSYIEQGFSWMQASEYRKAIDSFSRAHSKMNSRLFFFEVAMPVFPRMVEAMLGPDWHQGGATESCDPKSAKKYARLARFFSLSFPNIRPHTWRVLGRFHQARGKTSKARKCFERSIVEADKIGAKYERARALIDSGIVSPDLSERKKQGLEELAALGAVMPEAEMAAAQAQ